MYNENGYISPKPRAKKGIFALLPAPKMGKRGCRKPRGTLFLNIKGTESAVCGGGKNGFNRPLHTACPSRMCMTPRAAGGGRGFFPRIAFLL